MVLAGGGGDFVARECACTRRGGGDRVGAAVATAFGRGTSEGDGDISSLSSASLPSSSRPPMSSSRPPVSA